MRHIEAVVYQFRYGNQYQEKDLYFEQYIYVKQENLTVDGYTRQYKELESLCGLWER